MQAKPKKNERLFLFFVWQKNAQFSKLVRRLAVINLRCFHGGASSGTCISRYITYMYDYESSPGHTCTYASGAADTQWADRPRSSELICFQPTTKERRGIGSRQDAPLFLLPNGRPRPIGGNASDTRSVGRSAERQAPKCPRMYHVVCSVVTISKSTTNH